jgi:hypothetical protein
MVSRRAILEDFPSIAPHWASCVAGCVEAISQYQFDTPPFADCDYDHTFHYERRLGGIRRDREGTNLDLTFLGMPVEFRTTAQRIRDRYGVELRHHYLCSADEFESFVLASLSAGCALAIFFDWFYVEGRREYLRIHAPHCMCLIGIDGGGGAVHLLDQYYGRLKISGELFADFIAYSSQEGRNGVKLMEVARVAHGTHDGPTRLVELGQNLRVFLDNLRSTDSSYGLAALQAFRDELYTFMDSERDAPAVFYVPGLWAIGMQRAHFAEALQIIAKANHGFSFPNRGELRRSLDVLHQRWFKLNFDAEAAVMTKRPQLLAQAMAGLDAIIEFERAVPEQFERVLCLIE